MSGGGEEGLAGGGSGAALKKGPWTAAEDAILMEYVKTHGEGNWNSVQKNSGLSRCGKSCRLRWANHLRPNLKKGSFSPEEERLILELHAKLGNKWARMAAQLPGRTDNEIKNYWNTRIKRRQRAGLPLYPPDIQRQAAMSHHRQAPPSPTSPKPSFSSPLQLLDPMSFSAATASPAPASSPFLSHLHHHPHPFFSAPPVHRLKRFHETPPLAGFSLPFASPPLFHQNLHTQQQQQSLGGMHFSPAGFDLNPPLLQQHFELAPPMPATTVKMELPSSQLPEAGPSLGAQTYKTADIGATSAPLDRSNCGLLDALLQDTQEIGSVDDSRREISFSEPLEKCTLDGWLPTSSMPLPSSTQWEESTSSHSVAGVKVKKEAKEDMSSVDEDLSSLLDIIPSSIPTVPEWYSDSGEGSNGHSAVTDDEIGLEMQQLASSLSATAAASDQDWSLGTCTWNNMPGIC